MRSQPNILSGIVTVDNFRDEGEMLAERIKQVIQESGLSPAEISRRLGVSRAAVSGWSNGLPVEAQEMLIATGTAFKAQVDAAQKGSVVPMPKKTSK